MNTDLPQTIKEQKKALRTETLRKIALLDPADAKEADKTIIRYVLSLPEYRKAASVFCFVGTAHEINTLPLLSRILSDGKQLAVPLCLPDRQMQARQIFSVDELKPGAYGILEPGEDAPCLLAEQIDLAVIPCLTCSHSGKRLGHGGGYYDRFFQKANGKLPAVMICRELLVCEDIPQQPHDLTFPLVVTDAGIFR